SGDATIAVGDTFTPGVGGGGGSGAKQVVFGGYTNWGDTTSFTPPSAGTYYFWARQLGDNEYDDSNIAGPYVLNVVKRDQSSVGSDSATIYVGDSFTPSISGGSGSGAQQAVY